MTTRTIGHNSTVGIDRSAFQKFVERIEALESEKVALGEDIREVYKEVKAAGFDSKTVRKLIARRKISEAEREEEARLLALYESIVGDG